MSDHQPDYMDLDDNRVAIVCHHCGKDAVVITRDFGIDDGHPRGVHRDERDCCSECGEEL
jgi:hypothetical protein